MNWRDDESSWKGPRTFAALAGVDRGTALACVTPNMWPVSNVLPAAFDMSRCYFFAGGGVQEVRYTGVD